MPEGRRVSVQPQHAAQQEARALQVLPERLLRQERELSVHARRLSLQVLPPQGQPQLHPRRPVPLLARTSHRPSARRGLQQALGRVLQRPRLKRRCFEWQRGSLQVRPFNPR